MTCPDCWHEWKVVSVAQGKRGVITTEQCCWCLGIRSYERWTEYGTYGAVQGSWHRHGYSYYGTYCHEIDAAGKTLSVTFHDDLADELQSWIRQRDEDARAYREAGTLSAHQLCDVGRAA